MVLPEWLRSAGKDEPDLKAARDAEAAQPQEDPEPQQAAEPDPAHAPVEAAIEEPATEEPAPEEPAPAPEAETPPSDEILQRLAAMEQRLQQLGQLEREPEPTEIYPDSDVAIEGLTDGQALAEREADLQRREEELDAEHDKLETLAGKIAEEQEAAAMQAAESAEAVAALTSRVQELEQELAQAAADGEDRQAAAKEATESAERIAALKDRVGELELQLAQAAPGDGDDEIEAEDRSEEIEQLQAELLARDEAIADLREQLEQTSGTAPAADPGAAGDDATQEMVQRQRRQIERLTEQLAALKTGDYTDEIAERDARIADLEEQLQDQRGEGGGKSVARLMAGFGGALGRKRAKGGGDEAAELEDRIEELTAECDRLKDEVEVARAGALPAEEGAASTGAEVVALKAQVRELQKELTEKSQETDKKAKPDAALKKRIKELEQELDAARKQKPARDADGPKQNQKLHEQREGLKQLQRSLAASEKEMIRKWARPRAVVVYGCMMGILAVVAIGSALAANHFFPATVAASINVQAKTETGLPIKDADADKWKTWHTAFLAEDDFLKTVAKRLGDQRIEEYADEHTLAKRLKADLTFDSPKPGELVITLAGTDARQTLEILDVIGSSLAVESSRQAGKRSDGAVAVVRGETRDSNGRLSYATIRPKPIKDRRLLAGAFFFTFGFVISLFLMLKISGWLIQARQAMDDEVEITEAVF